MKEISGNLWHQKADALCITTNGFVKSNGEAVMGRGCAAEAKRMDSRVPGILGTLIKRHGNVPHVLFNRERKSALVSFPVKPVIKLVASPQDVVKHKRAKYPVGQIAPGWACVADKELIIASAHLLVKLADKHGWGHVVLPRPGCGHGELSWDEIREVLIPILDDRFSVISF